MPQLHFSVDQRTAQQLARRARAQGLSLSRYVAQLVQEEVHNEWPRGYLEAVVGSCRRHPIPEVPELKLDEVTL